MKRWWVVIYPLKEYDHILEVLEREEFDIEMYRPTIKVSVTRKGIVHFEEKPLMFNYMFWRYDLEVLPYEDLRKYMRFGLMRRTGHFDSLPSPVSSREIRWIKKIAKRYNSQFDLARSDPESLRRFIGGKVVVIDGVFNGMIGFVKDSKRPGYLDVELMIFSRLITCEISVEYLEFS